AGLLADYPTGDRSLVASLAYLLGAGPDRSWRFPPGWSGGRVLLYAAGGQRTGFSLQGRGGLLAVAQVQGDGLDYGHQPAWLVRRRPDWSDRAAASRQPACPRSPRPGPARPRAAAGPGAARPRAAVLRRRPGRSARRAGGAAPPPPPRGKPRP